MDNIWDWYQINIGGIFEWMWRRQIFHISASPIRGVVIADGGIAHEKNARSGRAAAMRSGQGQTGHQFHQNKEKQANLRLKRWFLLNWWRIWLWIYTTGMEIVQRTSSKSDDVRSPCCQKNLAAVITNRYMHFKLDVFRSVVCDLVSFQVSCDPESGG